MTKLKPCPFCGETDYIVVRKQVWNGYIYYFVECMPCDARSADCYDVDAELNGFTDGREESIARWNARRKNERIFNVHRNRCCNRLCFCFCIFKKLLPDRFSKGG